jgi:hypothetical protein
VVGKVQPAKLIRTVGDEQQRAERAGNTAVTK